MTARVCLLAVTTYFVVGFLVLFELDSRTEGQYGNWLSLSATRRVVVFLAWPVAAPLGWWFSYARSDRT